MELVMEEYGQALLAMLVMAIGLGLALELIVNEGVMNEMMLTYMESIGG